MPIKLVSEFGGGWGGREYNTTSAIRQLMSSVRPLAR